jgi:hypothetical protein
MSKYISVLIFALLVTTTNASAQTADYSYRDFVKYSSTSRADKQLHAFLEGEAYVILADYVCDKKDTDTLHRPDAIVEELLRFATTDWGKLYLEYEGSLGVMRYPMTVGDVMLKYYTQHSHCQWLGKAKAQFAR